jgi:mycothiol synthase
VEISLRPLTLQDTGVWAALLAAAERADETGEHYSAEDLAEEFTDPTRDRDRDFVGAWAGDQLVGFASVMARDTLEPGVPPAHRIYLEGTTHPDHRGRGIGTELLAWAVRRGGEAHDGLFAGTPALLQCNGPVGNSAQVSLLEGSGFVAQRWMFGMERDLERPVAPCSVPRGLTVLAYGPSWAEAVRCAHNDAFADHWGFTPWSTAMWQQWVSDTRAFRPAISRVLVEDGRADGAVGYLVGYEYDAETAATGVREAYVGKLGIRRPWRGRGAGSALLSSALQACHDAGYERASLDVDADNPTGALDLYRRAGFEVRRRSATYIRRLG